MTPSTSRQSLLQRRRLERKEHAVTNRRAVVTIFLYAHPVSGRAADVIAKQLLVRALGYHGDKRVQQRVPHAHPAVGIEMQQAAQQRHGLSGQVSREDGRVHNVVPKRCDQR